MEVTFSDAFNIINSGESEGRGRLRKAETHVHEGALSRAAHLLTSSGLAPDTDDTLQKLERKNTSGSF